MSDTIVGEPVPGYPDIHMVDKPFGVRAMLIGHRLEVRHIVQMAEDYDGSCEEVAHHLNLSVSMVENAMRYYHDHRAEVDRWIEENNEAARQGFAEWKRKQGHLLPDT